MCAWSVGGGTELLGKLMAPLDIDLWAKFIYSSLGPVNPVPLLKIGHVAT